MATEDSVAASLSLDRPAIAHDKLPIDDDLICSRSSRTTNFPVYPLAPNTTKSNSLRVIIDFSFSLVIY